MPPLGMFDPKAGFMPDLPVLLMFDEFTIDEQAAARISTMPNDTWLGQWPEVVAYLRSEGCLQEVDLIRIRKETGAKRGQMTLRDMTTPTKWLHAMHVHDSLLGSAEDAFSEAPNVSEALDWTFDPATEGTIPGPDGHSHSVRVLMSDESPDEVHADLVPNALGHLRRQLSEVNAGILIAEYLDGVLMFWAPYSEYYRVKASGPSPIQDVSDSAEAARRFFDVAFPRFRPDTVEHLSKLRSDPRIKSLRDEIVRASRSGDSLDPQYPQSILQEVLRTDKSVERLRRITGWISSAVGIIPGASLAATAIGEVAASAATARKRKHLEWMYVVSDGVGNS